MVSFADLQSGREKISVVGLGYVGLPLAVLLASRYQVIGFDVDREKIRQLKQGRDLTGEVESRRLREVKIEFTAEESRIREAKFIILAIPTPIDNNKKPDLVLLKKASAVVGRNLIPGSVVVYESTVYPGVTEEICLPILEKESSLSAGRDFKVGYSPERVNPGDRGHTIENIVKVVSAMDQESLDLVDRIYRSVVRAGTFRASSIKVAEAAKVIENTQRDLNIALVNELAIIFQKLGLNSYEVLAAATSKWNFIKFTPGLVGGHCIGIDPYYLTYKAESLGYHPEVILAGRRINDFMGRYIAVQAVKKMAQLGKPVNLARAAILGITFKENVPDIRNSKVVDIYRELSEFGLRPLVYDPLADKEEVKKEYGFELCPWERVGEIDVLILAVAHQQFCQMSLHDYRRLMTKKRPLIVDIKHILSKVEAENAGIEYWAL